MRTVVVTHTFPWPARGGGAIRIAHTIRALAELGDVDVACIVQPNNVNHRGAPDGEPVDRVLVMPRPRPRVARWRRLPWLVSGRLPSMRSADYSDVRVRFTAWAGQYDLAWLGSGTEAFVALRGVLAPQIRVVANLDDLEDRKLESRRVAGHLPCVDARASAWAAPRSAFDRLVTAAEIRRWRSLHVRLAAGVDRTVVCSEVDRRALASLGVANAVVLPNVYPEPVAPVGRLDVGDPPVLSLVGTLDYPPNVDAARFMVHCVLPEVRRHLPHVELRLVGRPGSGSLDLGRLPGVVATGQVDDIVAELAKADVIVVPVRFGGGTRIKILEAFAHRIPVVSTTIGAEGLGVTHRRELLLADDPAEFAKACVEVLADRRLRERLVSNGHAHWAGEHRVEALNGQVCGLVRDLVGTGR